MDRLVQRAGDVVTILVGVVLLIMVASRFFAPDNEPINPVDVHLDTESVGIDFASHSRTLIMALDSECVYCAESMRWRRRHWS